MTTQMDLPRVPPRGQVVHRSLLNRRHDQHVRENAPVERERASGSGRREPAGKVDLDVVKIQKLVIERIGRFVDRLLDGKEKLCPQRIVSNRTSLPRCGDQTRACPAATARQVRYLCRPHPGHAAARQRRQQFDYHVPSSLRLRRAR